MRRAVMFSAALATAAASVAIGAGAASATETTPSPEPTPSVSVSPSPSTSPSTPATPPKQAPEPKPQPKPADVPAAGTAKVSGRVWHDTNKNGLQDKGEEPAKGFHVYYYASSVIEDDAEALKRAADPTDPDAGNAVTDEEGRYSFDAVLATKALVAVSKSTSDGKKWAFSPKAQGDDRALDSDFSHGPNERPYASSGVLNLKPGDELVLDAGVSPVEEDPAVVGEVSGRVWHDTDHDGIQDAGEPGVANVPLQLVAPGDVDEQALRSKLAAKAKAGGLKSRTTAEAEPDDGFFAFVLTDAQGNYVIDKVPTGDYLLGVIAATVKADGDLERGYRVTKYRQGADRTKDSDVEPAIFRDGTEEYEAGLSKKIPVEVDNLGLKHDVDAGLVKGDPPAPGDGGGELPTTGFAIGGFLAAGLALVGGGVALTLAARRRRLA